MMESQQVVENRQPRDVSGRVTKNQKVKLVDFMCKNVQFARGLFTGINGSEETKKMWSSLAADLNACGGCIKTPDQWKKCWQDMKNTVKKLEVARKKFASKTGGGNWTDPDAPRQLTSIEEEILKIMTSHAVEGDGVTPEGGFAQPSTSAVTLPVEIDDEIATDFSPPPKRRRNTFKALHEEALETATKMQAESLSRMDKLIEGNTNVLKAIENTNNTQLQLCQSINKLIDAIKK